MSLGRPAEAIVEGKRAQEVDPLSLTVRTDVASYYIDARQPDEAIAQIQKAIEMDKTFPRAHVTLADAYVAEERYEDALAEYERAMLLNGRNTPEQAARKTAMLRDGYKRSGAKGFWEGNLQLRIENVKQGYNSPPTAMAVAYARVGDKDRAFEWLEKAYTGHDQYLFYFIKPNAAFDGIRSDPRYTNLLQRIGLPQ